MTFGKRLADYGRGIEAIGRGIIRDLDDIGNELSDSHRRIKRKGGYMSSSHNSLEPIIKSTKEGVRTISDFTRKLYDSLDYAICIDGDVDAEKIKVLLRNKWSEFTQYGDNSIEDIITIIRNKGNDIGSNVSKRYRAYFPSKEEMDTKYEGIGSEYRSILLRPDLDACLAFHDQAEIAIPNDVNAKAEILVNIKSSASVCYRDIQTFYRNIRLTNYLSEEETEAFKYIENHLGQVVKNDRKI